MTLIRRVVRSDFFAINLTPEEARPGTEPLRRVLEFLSTLSVITAVIYGNTDPGITSSGKYARKPSYMYFYETVRNRDRDSREQFIKKKKKSPSKINETVQTR